jgi:predicted XRE-type DNA-binding protein
MTGERFDNVWDAICDTPAEAANMKLRSELMMALEKHIEERGWNQVTAAQHLGVTQPRISDLMRRKIHLFGFESLINMATSAGLSVSLDVQEKAVA